jgi:hypothetical protein
VVLLNFGRDILQAPPRAGKRHSLAKLIKCRIDGKGKHKQENETELPSRSRKPQKLSKRSPEELLAATVSSKVEDGNIRAAARILFSDERPAEMNDTHMLNSVPNIRLHLILREFSQRLMLTWSFCRYRRLRS